MLRAWQRALIAGIAIITFAAPAHAAVIQFQARDLTDVVSGEDLWAYDYFVSGQTFLENQGFSIFFNPAQYASLAVTAMPSADWDVIALQPEPALPDDGLYDALALVSGASLANPFTVTFRWLGGADLAPGAQTFTVNQFDSAGALSVLETGRTVALENPATVPEPSTLALIALGAIGFAARRRSHGRP